MHRKYIVITLLLFVSVFVKAQTGWVKQDFNNQVTIAFPAPVKKVSETTYISRDSLGTVFGVVLVALDKSEYAQTAITDTLLARIGFIDKVVNDIKSKMPNYAIGDIKINQINNTKVYSLEGNNDVNKSKVYINIFIAGGTSYSLTCFTPQGADQKNKDIFLKNFSVAK